MMEFDQTLSSRVSLAHEPTFMRRPYLGCADSFDMILIRRGGQHEQHYVAVCMGGAQRTLNLEPLNCELSFRAPPRIWSDIALRNQSLAYNI